MKLCILISLSICNIIIIFLPLYHMRACDCAIPQCRNTAASIPILRGCQNIFSSFPHPEFIETCVRCGRLRSRALFCFFNSKFSGLPLAIRNLKRSLPKASPIITVPNISCHRCPPSIGCLHNKILIIRSSFE